MRRALLALALIFSSRIALGDPTLEESAMARTLFEEGRKLMVEGDYAGAAAKLEASERLFPGKGIVYNLAVCYEKLGRTASAWSRYMEVAAASKRGGDAERADIARENADAIAKRVPHHTILVTGDASLIFVTRDGQPVAPNAIGASVPVDPGHHVIAARADGFQAYSVDVDLREGQAQTTTVPALVPIASQTTALVPPAPTEPAPYNPKPAIVWTLAITGAVGIVTGTVLGALSINSYSRSNQYCNAGTNECNDTGLALRQESIAFGDASTVAFVAGAVLGVAAVVIWLAVPSKKPHTASLPLAISF